MGLCGFIYFDVQSQLVHLSLNLVLFFLLTILFKTGDGFNVLQVFPLKYSLKEIKSNKGPSGGMQQNYFFFIPHSFFFKWKRKDGSTSKEALTGSTVYL